MDRPIPQFNVGDEIRSPYHDEQGTIQKVDWSVTFGRWGYLIRRTKDSRYGGKEGTEVWVYEGGLQRVPG